MRLILVCFLITAGFKSARKWRGNHLAQIRRENDARTAYQAALQTLNATTQEYWSRFNVMLVAKSTLVAAVIVISTAAAPPMAARRLSVLLPVLGAILCVIWVTTIFRQQIYREFYASAVLEIETLYLSRVVDVFQRSSSLSRGELVKFTAGTRASTLRMPRFVKGIRASTTGYFVAYIFFLVHLVLSLSLWGLSQKALVDLLTG